MEELFVEFIASLSQDEHSAVEELHALFLKYHCRVDIKSAKSGYVVSYIHTPTKKTVCNIVNRKSGMKVRMYLDHIATYEQVLDQVPSAMKQEIRKASICKRLIEPSTCNQKCAMGYQFHMDGKEWKLCRNMAFMPSMKPEYHTYILQLLEQEVRCREQVALA